MNTLQRKLLPIKRSANGWTVFVLLAGLFVLVPVFTLVLHLFEGPGETWYHLVDTVLTNYIINSFLLMIGVGIISLIFGVCTAWLVSTCRFPGSKLFSWSLSLPLATPTYIVAYTYVGMFGYTGPVNKLVKSLGFEQGFHLDLMNLPFLMLLMASVLFPYVYVITKAYYTQQSNSLIEASQSLGHGPWSTFFKVALPVARPAMVGGLTLVLMEVLNDYGAVKYFGISTFTTGIFRSWFSLGDVNAAIYLSSLLLVTVFALLIFEKWQRKGKNYEESSKHNRPLIKKPLKGMQAWGASMACFLPLLIGFLLPFLQLLYWSWMTFEKTISPQFWMIVKNSFGLSAVTALLTVLLATLILYSCRVNKSNWLSYYSKVSVLGYSIPGAVIAIGILIPLLAIDKWIIQLGAYSGLLFTGSAFALVLAYIIRFLAVAYNPVESAFQKQCRNLDDAARVLGSKPWPTLFKVNLPLIKGSIVAAGLLVFVDVLKELPLTLILRPFNFDTLATRAFELASDEMVPESASVALLIICTGIIPVLLLNRLISK